MRAFKLALLILALLPTIYLREQKRRVKLPYPPIMAVDLMPALRAGGIPDTGTLHLVGAWRFVSKGRNLGTFSGLARTDGGFVTVGDRGAVMWFSRPDRPGPWSLRLTRLVPLDWRKVRFPTDAESVAIVPGSCDLVVGYEDAPVLERYSPDLARRTQIAVPALAEWPPNQGPEAMTLLADRRMVIVAENYARWFDRTRHVGLIFPGVPRSGEAPARFELSLPAGYRPSELAQMPDGRLLVLGRHFSITGFRSLIAIFAVRDVRPGAKITPKVIARIDDQRIRDNYEGMTVTREADGSQLVWLIADSNEMVWAQRTLVLKLRIGPEAN